MRKKSYIADLVRSPFVYVHISDFNNLNETCQTQELVHEYLFFFKKKKKKKSETMCSDDHLKDHLPKKY